MKNLSKFIAPAALAAAALMASQAYASQIYAGSANYNDSTYIGAYDPTLLDFGSATGASTVTGSFVDTLVFDFSPAGSATMNANFNPTSYIDGFQVDLYAVTSSSCLTMGLTCGSVVRSASPLATGTLDGSASNISWTSLGAGQYAIVVSGDATTVPVTWSGQLSTNVPEPSTLAMVGLVLAGLGVGLRKRKTA